MQSKRFSKMGVYSKNKKNVTIFYFTCALPAFLYQRHPLVTPLTNYPARISGSHIVKCFVTPDKDVVNLIPGRTFVSIFFLATHCLFPAGVSVPAIIARGSAGLRLMDGAGLRRSHERAKLTRSSRGMRRRYLSDEGRYSLLERMVTNLQIITRGTNTITVIIREK
jgi:hypothetical protein